MVHSKSVTKRHGVKLSLSTPDLRQLMQQLNPDGPIDRPPLPSTDIHDAFSTPSRPQKIRRKRYSPNELEHPELDVAASLSVPASTSGDFQWDRDDSKLQVQPHLYDNPLERSTSWDDRSSCACDLRGSPSAPASDVTSATYPLRLQPAYPLVALHDDENLPRCLLPELQEAGNSKHPTASKHSVTSTSSTLLPELAPLSPAFSVSFYYTHTFSPSQLRFDSTIPSSTVSSSCLSSQSRCTPCAPSPPPSRITFIDPPKEAISPAVTPPHRSSLLVASLYSPSACHFSHRTISSSRHSSTSSLGSGSRVSVISMPVSPLSPSIPITPPPEELKRRRIEKLERTLGAIGVGHYIDLNGDVVNGGGGKEGSNGTGNGLEGKDGKLGPIRDRPARFDSLSSPPDRTAVAPWDAIPVSEPKSALSRKLTKTRPKRQNPSPPRSHAYHHSLSDAPSKVKHIPAPIIITAPASSRVPYTDTEGDLQSHIGEKEAEVVVGSAPKILLSPPAALHSSTSTSLSRNIDNQPPSSHPGSPSSSSSSEDEDEDEERPSHSRSGSLSSIEYAPGLVSSSSESESPVVPLQNTANTGPRSPRQGNRKDYGTRRRSKSVSHVYNESGLSLQDALRDLAPFPGEAMPRSSASSGPKTPRSPRGRDLDHPRYSHGASSHSMSVPPKNFSSQRYVKPVTRAAFSSPSSSSMPTSASTSTLLTSNSSASSSTLNIPIPRPAIPNIPSIHVSSGKSLKRSTSFSTLLRKGKPRKGDGKYDVDQTQTLERVRERLRSPINGFKEHGESKDHKGGVMGAEEEWRAQLKKSEREVLAGFKLQSNNGSKSSLPLRHGPGLSPSSQPSSRPSSRPPSRKPSRNNMASVTSTAPSSYFAPPRTEDQQPQQSKQQEYGRTDHRVCGQGWSGEWNLPLDTVIHNLRMM